VSTGEKLGTPLFASFEVFGRLALAAFTVIVANSVFVADVDHYFRTAEGLGLDNLPYRDFLWEYPPLAAVPLVLIPLTADNVLAFRLAFVFLMLLVEYAALVVLRRAAPEHSWTITKFWMAAVFPVATIAWFRLDFLTTLAAAVAVVGLASGRRYVVATVIGIGVKLWPAVFGVAMLVQRRWKEAAATVLGSAALFGAWFAYSPKGVRDFVAYREGDGFQVETIPGAFLVAAGREPSLVSGAVVVPDTGFEWIQILLQALFVAVPLVVTAVAIVRRDVNLVALLGALVCVMLLANRLLSPQFLVWLAPFVAWLWPSFRRQGLVFVAAAWITPVVIQAYGPFLRGNELLAGLVLVRNALLIWLMVELTLIAFRKIRTPEQTYEPVTQ
jgi:hypothetical protein